MRGIKYVTLYYFSLVLLFSCNSSWKPITNLNELEFQEYNNGFDFDLSDRIREGLGKKYEHYLYDEEHPLFTPMKYIRVNVHFINNLEGTAIFDGERAIEYAKGMVYQANLKLDNNQKMNLPKDNDTPAHPIPFRYVLTPQKNKSNDQGIYIHYDENPWFINYGKKKNNYDKSIIDKYAINQDSVLNIFFMAHHPDSIASATYKAGQGGIALGNSCKIGINFDSDANTWDYVGLVNHEIGHILSLSHTWSGRDGCDDTPAHPNCWNIGRPPCNELVSNNVMDYNSVQDAYSPCQIAKAYATLNLPSDRKRSLVRKDWCRYDSTKTITISDSIQWGGGIDLYGDLIIEKGGFLQINSYVHFPKGGTLLIKSGGTLFLNGATLYNDCNEEWEGIYVENHRNVSGSIKYSGKIAIRNTPHPLILNSDR